MTDKQKIDVNNVNAIKSFLLGMEWTDNDAYFIRHITGTGIPILSLHELDILETRAEYNGTDHDTQLCIRDLRSHTIIGYCSTRNGVTVLNRDYTLPFLPLLASIVGHGTTTVMDASNRVDGRGAGTHHRKEHLFVPPLTLQLWRVLNPRHPPEESGML